MRPSPTPRCLRHAKGILVEGFRPWLSRCTKQANTDRVGVIKLQLLPLGQNVTLSGITQYCYAGEKHLPPPPFTVKNVSHHHHHCYRSLLTTRLILPIIPALFLKEGVGRRVRFSPAELHWEVSATCRLLNVPLLPGIRHDTGNRKLLRRPFYLS